MLEVVCPKDVLPASSCGNVLQLVFVHVLAHSHGDDGGVGGLQGLGVLVQVLVGCGDSENMFFILVPASKCSLKLRSSQIIISTSYAM